MNNSTVAHRWANKKYDRNGQLNGSNFYADDHYHCIYSYGSHYIIGRHVTEDMFDTTSSHRFSKAVQKKILKRYGILIKKSDGYSISTSKHVSLTYTAVSHLQKLELCSVPEYDFNKSHILDTIGHYINEANDKIELYNKARVKMLHLFTIEECYDEVKHLKKYFGLTYKDLGSIEKSFRDLIKWVDNITDEERGVMREKYGKKYGNQGRVFKRGKTKELSVKEQIEGFKNYKRNVVHALDVNRAYLRISKKGNEVETSKMVKIPFTEARKLWYLVEKYKKEGKVFETSSHKVNDLYSLGTIKKGGEVIIGCHTISYEEMESVKEKVFEETNQTK